MSLSRGIVMSHFNDDVKQVGTLTTAPGLNRQFAGGNQVGDHSLDLAVAQARLTRQRGDARVCKAVVIGEVGDRQEHQQRPTTLA
jgi:hypothetical protein